MSVSVDVNVLLYASNEASPQHSRAVKLLRDLAAEGSLLCLAWTTLMGYLRIATHPAIFPRPLTPDAATANVGALLALRSVRVLCEGEGFWDAYREVTRGLKIRGNQVPDAHLAALLRQHGVRTLYSNDADFRRFTFLELRNPFEESE